jgi:hypothetical protein
MLYVSANIQLSVLTPEQQRSWNNLNQPPYTAFRNSSKLSKPEKGTLQWLVQGEVIDDNIDLQVKENSQDSLRMEDFISWRDSTESEHLLVTAPPGRGKSVLSNFVLGDLESNKSLRTTKIIYYFCNIKNDETSRNANTILRALIVQLCEHQQRLFQILPSDYERQDRFSSASFDTLWNIFEQMLRDDTYAQIYCVIDGLDVYEEGMGELISKLIEFRPTTNKEQSILKLFCTSRPQENILDLWESSVRRVLRCNTGDLEVFIVNRIEALGKHFNENMRQTVKSRLLNKADNTFLWLEVVIRKIASIKLPTLSKIEETIKDSPKSLDVLYDMLVHDIVQDDRESARLLVWVVYARRPLDLEALADAIAIDPKKTYTSYRQCLEDRPSLESEEIYKGFGTLLDVVEGKVYLIHQSVKDYFQRENPLSAIIDMEPRLLLAHVSMAYLSLEDFACPSSETATLLQEQPLFRYASNYWYTHIETLEDFSSQPSLRRSLNEIIPPYTCKGKGWMKANIAEDYHYRYFPPTSLPLQLSRVPIFFGIGWLAELLLNEESMNLEDDSEESSLLEAATQSPNGEVLQVLLHHEKCMELVVTHSVVERVARMFNKAIMTLLLNRRGADVQITEEVLIAAAGNANGNEVMALLLDQRGAEIIITEYTVATIASRFDKEVMAILLDQRGAEILITKEVVKAAAGNWMSGKEVMALILDQRGAEIIITEDAVATIAGLFDKEIMALLLSRRGAEIIITEDTAAMIAGRFDKEIMALLLDLRGAEIPITKKVVKAAAGNEFDGKEVMTLLLDQRGAEIIITEEAVKAAAGSYSGKEVIALLLDQRGAEIIITEEVVTAAAENEVNGKEVMALLLDQRGAEIIITEEVVTAAAGNEVNGKEVMALLLDQRGAEISITEEVVKAAAGNWNHSNEMMALLLNQRGAEIIITEEVVKAAAGNGNGKDVMALLLDQRGAEIIITEEVVKAAVDNWNRGHEVMALLLDQRGAEISITEEVVKVAAGNEDSGNEIMTLLLDRHRRGAEMSITEEVVEQLQQAQMSWTPRF